MGDQSVDIGRIRPGPAGPARAAGGAGRSWLKVPFAVAFLGFITIIALLLVNHHRELEHQDSMRTSALMDIGIYAAEFHLWFEEYMSGDAAIDIEKNWSRLDSADALVASVLNGGKTDHTLLTGPLGDGSLRKEVEGLDAQLSEFRVVAQDRLDNYKEAGIGSAADQLFDATYKRIHLKARALEVAFDEMEHVHRNNGNRTFVVIMSILTICGVSALLYISHLERRRRISEGEREGLIAGLRNAMDEIKTLSGILPVCAWCKKIRDDRGSWQKMETYMRNHSEAEFTHGICPDCAEKQKGGDLELE